MVHGTIKPCLLGIIVLHEKPLVGLKPRTPLVVKTHGFKKLLL